jgi:hypothetical protein
MFVVLLQEPAVCPQTLGVEHHRQRVYHLVGLQEFTFCGPLRNLVGIKGMPPCWVTRYFHPLQDIRFHQSLPIISSLAMILLRSCPTSAYYLTTFIFSYFTSSLQVLPNLGGKLRQVCTWKKAKAEHISYQDEKTTNRKNMATC